MPKNEDDKPKPQRKKLLVEDTTRVEMEDEHGDQKIVPTPEHLRGLNERVVDGVKMKRSHPVPKEEEKSEK